MVPTYLYTIYVYINTERFKVKGPSLYYTYIKDNKKALNLHTARYLSTYLPTAFCNAQIESYEIGQQILQSTCYMHNVFSSLMAFI